MTRPGKNHCSTCNCGTLGPVAEILESLDKRLLVHRASSPSATGGMPAPAHFAHWAKDDMLVSIIEEIEEKKNK